MSNTKENADQLGMDEGRAPIDFFDDEDLREVRPVATLERITALALEHARLSAKIAIDTVALAEEQAKLDKIERSTLPEIFSELGMSKFALDDGTLVEIKPSVNASITEERKGAAHLWLRENGFGGLIKSNISLAFGKGEEEEAKKALQVLDKAGFFPEQKDGVHPATLKAFVKEELEKGEEGAKIPHDVFGVFEFKQAKIKLPKPTKSRKK